MGIVDAAKDAVKKVTAVPRQAYEKVEETRDHIETKSLERQEMKQDARDSAAKNYSTEELKRHNQDHVSGKTSDALFKKRVERTVEHAAEMRKPTGQRITENVKRNASYVAGGLESTSKHMQLDRGGKEDEHGNVKGGEGIHPFSRSQPKQPSTKGHTHVATPRNPRPIQTSRFGSGLAFNTGSGMGFKTGIDFANSPVRQSDSRRPVGEPANPYNLNMNFSGLFRKPRK